MNASKSTHVTLLTAFPKSASQHMIAIMEKGIENCGFQRAKLGPGFGHNFLHASQLTTGHAPRERLFIYGHVPCTAHNEALMHSLAESVSCIITIRSLPDVVVSYAEHTAKLGSSPLDYGTPGLVDATPGWENLTTAERYDHIIEMVLPWYVTFINSWLFSTLSWPRLLFTFEEHTRYPAESLQAAARFMGVDLRPGAAAALSDPTHVERVNFNKGLSGRGLTELSARQLTRIRDLLNVNPTLRDSWLAKYLHSGYADLDLTVQEMLSRKTSGSEAPL